MTTLGDIVSPDTTHIRDAAINLDVALARPGYVQSYTPTKAAIDIFQQLTKAASPGASKADRAIICHGPYGSGKSHLGVVIGRLLREGADTEEFKSLLNKLHNLGQDSLAQDLRNTFLDPLTDRDAKPYLLISLNADINLTLKTTPLSHQLLEALYRTLNDNRELRDLKILTKTAFDAAVERYQAIIISSPDHAQADLSQWNLPGDYPYLTTDEMASDLVQHDLTAYKLFLNWHEAVCHGAHFNPVEYGGKNFISAYLEAGKNLVSHQYAGIAILWDEFGSALEILINDPSRSAITEVKELQDFVENVCEPNQGHTLFIGMTHVSLAEYGTRSNTAEDVRNRLKTIEGRFTPKRVELKASELDGYHLIGSQLRLTDIGREYLQGAQAERDKLRSVCQRLPMFTHLGEDLDSIITECYPIHPITVAALFAISTRYAQAARTAFTFIPALERNGLFAKNFNHELSSFSNNVVRLPVLVDYYKDSLQRESESDFHNYQRALAEILAKGDTDPRHSEILSVLMLSNLLGESFQATDEFIAAALYDASTDEPVMTDLNQQLNWLKSTGQIWKNDVTEVWRIGGEVGINVEELIEIKLKDMPAESLASLLNRSEDMRRDLFPQIAVHDLEPSPCGIVRSYQVKFLYAPISKPTELTFLNTNHVALVNLVMVADTETAQDMVHTITSLEGKPIYFWIPLNGIRPDWLVEHLRRYLAIQYLLKEDAHGEGLKRQLESKWEKIRQELQAHISDLFGRQGLEYGKAKIYKSGEPNPLVCSSWHQFRIDLARAVQRDYPDEIHVRNMNLNKVCDEDYLGRKMLTDIIEKVLDFADNPAYQDDLLGEKETSEPAAIIDGIFGANDIFIQRASGWDIKRIDETDGALRHVLEKIHGDFFRRSSNPFRVVSLREALMAPPFGLPPVSHALFASVALRQDQKRLVWQGSARNKPFATNLSNAFEKGSTYETRLEDFSKYQEWILYLLGASLPAPFTTYEPKRVIANLQSYLDAVPPAIKGSPKLGGTARLLVGLLSASNKSAHQIADALIENTPAKVEFNRHRVKEDCVLTNLDLVKCFESFSELMHENFHELKRHLENCLINVDRAILESNLAASDDYFDRNLLRAIQSTPIDEGSLNQLAGTAFQRRLEECDDRTIGQLIERIQNAIKIHGQSKTQQNRERVKRYIEFIQLQGYDSIFAELLQKHDHKIQIQSLRVACADPCDDNLDNLVSAWLDKSIEDCSAEEVSQLAFKIEESLDKQKRLTYNLDYLQEKLYILLNDNIDKAQIVDNLRLDGSPLAKCLMGLIEATQPFDRTSVEQLMVHGLQKPIEYCQTSELDLVLENLARLISEKSLRQDIRDLATKELLVVIKKYEIHFSRSELISIVSGLINN